MIWRASSRVTHLRYILSSEDPFLEHVVGGIDIYSPLYLVQLRWVGPMYEEVNNMSVPPILVRLGLIDLENSDPRIFFSDSFH